MEIKIISVQNTEDTGAVRRGVKQVARKIGFGDAEMAELDIVASELATNLVVHHTMNGKIIVSEISDILGPGIEIVAQDRGPGIPDLESAMEDYYTTNGSLGCGLGAVRRLMDEFDIYSHPPPAGPDFIGSSHAPSGTVVTTRKWVKGNKTSPSIMHSAYSRPLPGQTHNGDAYFVDDERDGLFVAVADGLGHGPEAEKASSKAIRFIRDNMSMAFDDMLLNVHDKLHKTRGTSLTLVRLSLSDRTVTHAGIGNVEVRIYPSEGLALVPRYGVLGMGPPPKVKINRTKWPHNGILIIFTDGLSGRWDINEIPGFNDLHVTTISNLLIGEHARPKDDATVVVVKEITQ